MMEKEWTDFQAETYLKVGMQGDAIRIAIRKIVNKMRIMPNHVKGAPHATLRAIVSKIPSSPSPLHDEKKKYLRALDLSEKFNAEPTLESRVLSIDTITEWIINDIASHSSSHDREASAAERERARAAREGERKKGPCNVCGEAHHFWQCDKSPCNTCSKKWCQSRRGKVCWKLLDTIPEYTDFQNKPLNKKLIAEMNEVRKAAGKPIEASAAEMPPSLPTISEEEEDFSANDGLVNPQPTSGESSGIEARLPLKQTRPSHFHVWRWTICLIHDIDSCCFRCDECGATYCDMCNDGPRPSYGPWKPGPVDELPGDLCQRPGPVSEAAAIEIQLVQQPADPAVGVASEASAADEPPLLQIDSGANVVLIRPGTQFADAGSQLSADTSVVALASDSTLLTQGEQAVEVTIAGDTHRLIGRLSADARRNVAGTTELYRQLCIAVLLEPWNVAVHIPTRSIIELFTPNGLTFMPLDIDCNGVSIKCSGKTVCMNPLELLSLMTATQPECSSVASDETDRHRVALLWAMRFDTDSAGLKKLIVAARGVPIASVTPNAARLIDADRFRIASVAKRAPNLRSIRPSDKPTKPGTHWQLDGWGHMSVPCVVDKSTYQFLITDSMSDVLYVHNSVDSTQTTVFIFLDLWQSWETALEHKPVELRVDAVPNLNTPEFRQECARRYNLYVPEAAGNDHEHVARIEAAQDPVTRAADASYNRANRPGLRFFLRARQYAAVKRNFRCSPNETKSRIHIHTGKPSDFTRHPPLLFFCPVEVIKIDKPILGGERTEQGVVIGLTAEHKYRIFKEDTGKVIIRRDVKPIGEYQMALRGMPPSSVQVNALSQTDDADFPPLQLLQPPAAQGRSQLLRLTPGYDPLPEGTPLLISFKDEQGLWIDYPCKIFKSHPQSNGKVLTQVKWDDQKWNDDPEWSARLFDLASQLHRWRQPAEPAAAAAPVPAPTVAHSAVPTRAFGRGRPIRQGVAISKPVTTVVAPTPLTSNTPSAAEPIAEQAHDNRRSARLASLSGASAAIAAAIEVYPAEEHVELFHNLVYHHHGDAFAIECASIDRLDDARVSLLVAETAIIDGNEISSAEFVDACALLSADASSRLEVSKASQEKDVYIKTPSGGYMLHIPQNKKEHAESPQKDQWKVAQAKAHLTIISDPRNSLVKKRWVKSIDGIIAPWVAEDKAKRDMATGYLIELKTRLCYAQNVVDRVRLKLDKVEYHRLYNCDSDDLAVKAALSLAALDQAACITTDLKDAFWNADRHHSPLAFMETYEPMYDDEGDELCYCLGAPQNGERTAGSDYHIWRDGVFVDAGMNQSIECLGTFYQQGDNGRLTCITCTDDFLFVETGASHEDERPPMAMHVLGVFADRMGGWEKIKIHGRPAAYKGYGVAWSRDHSIVTLHMTTHIEALAKEWVPELFDDIIPSDILSGNKLTQAADSLELVLPRPHKPTKVTSDVQSCNGGVKYIERGVMPRVSLLVHRVSCVQSSACPTALIVSRSTVALMFRNRWEGITFGGYKLSTRVLLQGGMYINLDLEAGAPIEAEAMADTTTSVRAVYAYAITHNGGLLAHGTKKIDGVLASSCFSEMRGSTRCSELAELASNTLRIMGHPQKEIVLGTDNSANLSIALGTATPSRSKPDLIHWAPLRDRIRRKVIAMVKVATAAMPVDFMTKWLKYDKMLQQLNYLINARHAVWPG